MTACSFHPIFGPGASLFACPRRRDAHPPHSAGQHQEGAVIDGHSMIEADLAHQIDNMEGMAVHRTAGGEIILTLVSDDNFPSSSATCCFSFR